MRIDAAMYDVPSSARGTDEAVDSLRAVNEFLGRVIGALLADRGLPGVAEELAAALGRPVALWGAADQVLATSGDHAATAEDRTPEWRRVAVCHGTDAVTIGIHDPDGSTTDLVALVLEHAAQITALELYRIRSVADTELKLWGDLSRALLGPDDPERVGMLAASLGYDLDRRRRVIVTEPRVSDQELQQLHGQVRALDTQAMATRHDEHPVLIVTADCDPLALQRLIESRDTTLCLGASSPTSSERGLSAPLREAHLALRVNTTFGGANVLPFEDLGLYQLFAHADPIDLEAHAAQWLQPVLDHDRARNGELLQTLTEYLERGGAVEATAQALFIHRSTLSYRLRRIESLLGRDLANVDTRFNLQLATRALVAAASMRSAVDDASETGASIR
jgi:DNA-binding PucR family transcriptional regulator